MRTAVQVGGSPVVQTQPGTVALALVVAIALDFAVFTAWKIIAHRHKTRKELPLKGIIYNQDGYPGLAKFQFAVWTAVILPIFTWVYLVRLLSGVLQPV